MEVTQFNINIFSFILFKITFDISPQALNLQGPVCSLALSRMYSSSRRNFICRMRCGKEENDLLPRGKGNRLKLLDDEYAIVHCTGYIKVLSCSVLLIWR